MIPRSGLGLDYEFINQKVYLKESDDGFEMSNAPGT